jgi:prepilin-type N-terminal cleavage/methylation domain-containing protein
MKHTFSAHSKTLTQQGFTLVEIAIVLVIVGLLLGGVMKGQELITSAKVRSFISKQQAVNMAWFSFQDRFQVKPGDMTIAAAQAQISASVLGGGNADGTITSQESDNLWEHLALAGFLSGSYTPAAGAGPAAVEQCTTCMPNGFDARMNLATMGFTNAAASAANPYKVRALSGKIPSLVAKDVDTKLDDGIPLTGAIRVYTGLPAATAGICQAGAGATSTYNTTPANAIENCFITNGNF